MLYAYLRPGTEWKFPYWAFAGFLDARRRVLFSNGVAVSVVSSDSSGRVKASALFFLIFSYTLRSLIKSEALDVNMPATLRL